MRFRYFLLGLFFCNLLSFGVTALYLYFFEFEGAWPLTLRILVFFSALCILFYAMAYRARQSTDLFRYNRFVILSSIIKMVGSVLLVFLLKKQLGLTQAYQIVPFLVSYVFFTIYEVYFLTKMS